MIGESQRRSVGDGCIPDVPRGQHVTVARRIASGLPVSDVRTFDLTDLATGTPGAGVPRPKAYRVTWQQITGELVSTAAVTPALAAAVRRTQVGGEGWLELSWFDSTRGGRCIVDAAGGSVALPPTTHFEARLLLPSNRQHAAVSSSGETLGANDEGRVQVQDFQVSGSYAGEYDPGSHRAPTFTETAQIVEQGRDPGTRVFLRPDFASRVMVSATTLVGLASVRWLRYVNPPLNGGLITVERDEPAPGDAVAVLVTVTATLDVQVTWTLEL